MTIKGKIKNSIENGYDIMNRFENDVKHIKNVYGDCKDEILAEKIKEAAVRRDFDLLQNRKCLASVLERFKSAAIKRCAITADDIPEKTFMLLTSTVPLDVSDLERSFDVGNDATKRLVLKRCERDGISINRTVYSPEDYVNGCASMLTFYDSALQRPQWASLWLSDLDTVFPACLAGATDENL
ncbi:MAG: hypothetical protein BHW21_00950 [Eubacterium sp. 45_250]|nr:MAG: hypothetical protein BHW21_00950 [Eubacterium sp. 45_250]